MRDLIKFIWWSVTGVVVLILYAIIVAPIGFVIGWVNNKFKKNGKG